jgi:plasminogen activator inhibitor 1 RNA-binding protein
VGTNQFDLLVDVDNDDPSLLIAAAEKKPAASPEPTATALAAQARLPTKPLPPVQAGELIRLGSNQIGRRGF